MADVVRTDVNLVSGPSGPTTPPGATGDPAIDAALADLDDLDEAAVSEHHDRLARAHETLHAALDRPDGNRHHQQTGTG